MKQLKVSFIRYHFREPSTGIGNVCYNLEKQLQRFEDIKLISITPPKALRSSNLLIKIFNKLIFETWYNLWLPLYNLIKGVDVYIEMNMLIPRFQLAKKYFFIYDLAFQLFPDLVLKSNYRKRMDFLDKMNKEDTFFAISQSTADDFHNYTGIDASRVHITLLDSSLEIKNDQQPAKENYFLFVGTLEPRKNLKNIILGFYAFLENSGLDFELVLIGKKGWLYEDIFSAIDSKPQYKSKVRLVGYANNDELVLFYKKAYALLYPSIYEGFGLPVLESMRCGTPVITSHNSSLSEIGADAVLYPENIEPDGINDALLKLTNSQDLYNSLVKKGYQRAGMFSWDKFGESVHQVLIKENR